MEKLQYFQDQVLNFPHLISSCSRDDIKICEAEEKKPKDFQEVTETAEIFANI